MNTYERADALLDVLEKASVGTPEAASGEGHAKDWKGSCVIRAIRKLQAAEYHHSNIDSRLQDLRSEADATRGKGHSGLTRGEQPAIAFELDAFLAASRSCIDFIAGMLALHWGMDRKAGIKKLLKKANEGSAGPFDNFLRRWEEWILLVRRYRNECVHYRTLELTGGYTIGPKATVLPVLVAKELPPADMPATRRRSVVVEVLADIHGLVGFAGMIPPYGEIPSSNGAKQLMESLNKSKNEREASLPVEEFCRQHLEKLHQFVSESLQGVAALYSSPDQFGLPRPRSGPAKRRKG